MNYTMTFPNTWEEYERLYGFTDDAELYTNGCRLIPSFRVEQWLQHIAEHTDVPERKVGKWIDHGVDLWCSECGCRIDDRQISDYCPKCGAKMDGKEQKNYADWVVKRE